MERVCRVCLAKDRETYRVVNTALEQTYDVVTGVKLQRADRPTALCCVCVSQLRRCRRFIDTARASNDALDRWYYTHCKPTERPLFSFIKTPAECIDIWEPQLKQEQSTETGDASQSNTGAFITVQIKNEVVCNDFQNDPLHKSQANDNTETSDDEQNDIQTSDDEDDNAMEGSSDKRDISDVWDDVESVTTPRTSNIDMNHTESDLDIASTSYKSEKRMKLEQDTTAHRANIKNDDKATIVALHKEGRNITQIAAATGFTRKTVRRWVQRYKEEGTLACRMRPGRRPLLDHSQRRFMLHEYEQNGCITPKDFAEVFDTSVQTVRRALRQEGLHRKPFFLQRHKDERLRFARDYLDFNWETTVFCDEKTFVLSQKGEIRMCMRNNARDDSSVLNADPGKIRVTMLGWMSAQGPGELVFIKNRSNTERYIEILRDTILPTIRSIYPEDELCEINFVHDNPISQSSSVKRWFGQQSDIRVIPWPRRSPDLNPIESLWDVMVQRWEIRADMSLGQVKSQCLQLWDSLRGTDVCANIVGSIRQRLQSCIDNNGGHIKY